MYRGITTLCVYLFFLHSHLLIFIQRNRVFFAHSNFQLNTSQNYNILIFIVLFFPELSFSTNWQLILFLLQSEVVFNIIVNIADELYK